MAYIIRLIPLLPPLLILNLLQRGPIPEKRINLLAGVNLLLLIRPFEEFLLDFVELLRFASTILSPRDEPSSFM